MEAGDAVDAGDAMQVGDVTDMEAGDAVEVVRRRHCWQPISYFVDTCEMIIYI